MTIFSGHSCEFICKYENEISINFGKYDIKNRKLKKFCTNNSILIGSDCDSNNKKIPSFKHFILWDNKKQEKFKDIKGNDSVHNLLHHLRNAMAHSNIISENHFRYRLSDYNINNRRTMKGKIGKSLLMELIKILENTKS